MSIESKTSTQEELTVAAHVHCMKPPLVVQDQYISASTHKLGHSPGLDNVLLLPDEMGGRGRRGAGGRGRRGRRGCLRSLLLRRHVDHFLQPDS